VSKEHTVTYRFYDHANVLHGDADCAGSVGIMDFWRWAFSDLLEDTLKGHYAEWLVSQLLGLPTPHGGRPGYGNSDLRSATGLRIEVKSSAYWQSWKLRNEDGTPKSATEIERWRPTPDRPITFSRLRARDTVDRTDTRVGCKSDLYAFCFQSETDPARWDALDLRQWEFYLLTRAQVESLNVSSLSLKRLRSLCPPLTAREFQNAGRQLLNDLAFSRAQIRAEISEGLE
jgi:hypothetical protein